MKRDDLDDLDDEDLDEEAEEKEEKYIFDPKEIWVVSDGDGGLYAYDSKENADEYTKRTGEDEALPILRSSIEIHGYKAYQLLKQMEADGSLAALPNKKACTKLIKEMERGFNLQTIMEQLKLKLPKPKPSSKRVTKKNWLG